MLIIWNKSLYDEETTIQYKVVDLISLHKVCLISISMKKVITDMTIVNTNWLKENYALKYLTTKLYQSIIGL